MSATPPARTEQRARVPKFIRNRWSPGPKRTATLRRRRCALSPRRIADRGALSAQTASGTLGAPAIMLIVDLGTYVAYKITEFQSSPQLSTCLSLSSD